MIRVIYLLIAFAAAGLSTASGQTAMTDLGTGLYLGQYQGGLYRGGVNTPPLHHRTAARHAAEGVVPRDQSGAPSPDGLIGFASISMSNANQEWTAFKRRADQDPYRNARVVLVSGAQGGQSLDVISNASATYWSELDRRVEAAGLTDEQVQVVWLKMADAQPPTLVFPDHAINVRDNAVDVLQILKSRYPNLAIAFFSSRSYGGYASAANRSEPLSYETGFATKWLIDDQISGDPDLNHDPANGPVLSPLLLWGPYLWTNGTTPRSDGLVWLPSDLEPDMVHPSASGEEKVANMLTDFFESAPTSTPWYSKPVEERLEYLDATDDAWVDGVNADANHGSEDHFLVMRGRRIGLVKFNLRHLGGQIERAELCFNTHPSVASDVGLRVHSVSHSNWDEATVTFNNAPQLQGILHNQLPELSRGTAVSLDVTAQVIAALGGHLSFALSGGGSSPDNKVFVSREGGEAPRLVITLRPPSGDPGVPYCRSLPNSTGDAATLEVSGSSSLVRNNLVITASNLPVGEPVSFFFGSSSRRAERSDGILCVASPVSQLSQPVISDNLGQASFDVDFFRTPFQAGDVVYVQSVYSDPLGGPAGINFTSGLLISIFP